MSSLQVRLLSAESEFLSALDKGDYAVTAFCDRWESLLNEVDCAAESNDLDPETAQLAHTVALRCATLAEISADLVTSASDIQDQLMDELESLMANLFVDNIPYPHAVPQVQSTLLSSPSDDSWSNRADEVRSRKRRRSPSPSPPAKHFRGYQSPRISCGTVHSMADPPICNPLPPTASGPVLSCEGSIRKNHSQPLKRKRRLSDAELYVPAARPKRLCAGPRLHAVSDSYLDLRISSDDFLPLPESTPVTTCAPEPSALLDLELFPGAFCATVDADSHDCNELPNVPVDAPSFGFALEQLDTLLSSLYGAGVSSDVPTSADTEDAFWLTFQQDDAANTSDHFSSGSSSDSSDSSPSSPSSAYSVTTPRLTSPSTPSRPANADVVSIVDYQVSLSRDIPVLEPFASLFDEGTDQDQLSHFGCQINSWPSTCTPLPPLPPLSLTPLDEGPPNASSPFHADGGDRGYDIECWVSVS